MTLMDIPNDTIQDEPIDLRKKSALDRELERCTTPDKVDHNTMTLPSTVLFNEFPYKARTILHSALLETLSEYYFVSLPFHSPGIQIKDEIRLNKLNRSVSCSQISKSNQYVSRTRCRSASEVQMFLDKDHEFVLPAAATGSRHYSSRYLTGKYVKCGTGASVQTLMALRKAITEKQKGKETDQSGGSIYRKYQKKPERKN